MKLINLKSVIAENVLGAIKCLESTAKAGFLVTGVFVVIMTLLTTGCGRHEETAEVKSDNFDAVLLGGTVERVKSSELMVFAAGGDLPQLSSRVPKETVTSFRTFMLREIPIPPVSAQSQSAQAKLAELISTMAKIVRDVDSRSKIEKTILADAKTHGSKASLYRILLAYPTPLMQIDLAMFALSWKKLERLANELDQEYLQGFN